MDRKGRNKTVSNHRQHNIITYVENPKNPQKKNKKTKLQELSDLARLQDKRLIYKKPNCLSKAMDNKWIPNLACLMRNSKCLQTDNLLVTSNTESIATLQGRNWKTA